MMNLLVTLDSNYVGPLTVLLRSVAHSNPGTHFTIYVANSSLTKEDFEKIHDSVDNARFIIKSVKVDPSLLADAPVLKRISKETYYRLLVTDYLPEEVDRILYIDPDTVVIKPLDDFYNIEFGDNLLAGATHNSEVFRYFNCKRLNMGKDAIYLNAGILMMNIEEMRKCVSIPKIFQFIKENSDKLYLADQDVLNALYWDRMICVDRRLYNMDEKTLLWRLAFDTKWVEKHSVIIHYDGKNKPWNKRYIGLLRKYYLKHAEPQVKLSKSKA